MRSFHSLALVPGVRRIVNRSRTKAVFETPGFWTRPILSIYESLTENGLLQADQRQTEAAEKLDTSLLQLTPKHNRKVPGVYIYGEVGTGKSMLVDILAQSLLAKDIRAERIHFHDFMISIHKAMRVVREQLQAKRDVETKRSSRASSSKILFNRLEDYIAASEEETRLQARKSKPILRGLDSVPKTSSVLTEVAKMLSQSKDIIILDEFQVRVCKNSFSQVFIYPSLCLIFPLFATVT